MFQYPVEIAKQLADDRRTRYEAAATRERMLANTPSAHRNPGARWLVVTLAAAAPFALVMLWVLIAR